MFLQGSNTTNSSLVEEQGAMAFDASEPTAISDTGCERDLNEDRYAVVQSASGTSWIVCDGMGGQTGGELAAQLAIDAIRRDLESAPASVPHISIKSAISEANRIVVLRRQNQAFAQMGTTVVAAQFLGQEVVIANVGDSRAYLIRDGAMQQLTVDHTYVQELVDAGKITMDEALTHPQAHILTRCLGAEPGIAIDLFRFWVWPKEEGAKGDVLLLCTDGLYSLVDDGEISSITASNSPSSACVKLVELAKSRGGYDNITVAIIPLDGELRTECPEGYSAAKYLQAAQPRSAVVSGVSAKEIFRFILTLTILSILAFFIAALSIAVMIKI